MFICHSLHFTDLTLVNINITLNSQGTTDLILQTSIASVKQFKWLSLMFLLNFLLPSTIFKTNVYFERILWALLSITKLVINHLLTITKAHKGYFWESQISEDQTHFMIILVKIPYNIYLLPMKFDLQTHRWR